MRNNKRTIRLTESDLHRVIRESVKRILKEDFHNSDAGKAYQDMMTQLNQLRNKAGIVGELFDKEGNQQGFAIASTIQHTLDDLNIRLQQSEYDEGWGNYKHPHLPDPSEDY